MRQVIISLAVLALCGSGTVAFGGGGATGPPSNENYNMNTNTSKVSNDQTQKQTQGQDQGQYQSLEYSGLNSQSVNLNTPHQAPAFGVYASGPCSGISFAVSTVLGGGGVGFTDGECSKREAVRTFLMLNDPASALAIAKNLDAYKAVFPAKTEAAHVTLTSANHVFGQ